MSQKKAKIAQQQLQATNPNNTLSPEDQKTAELDQAELARERAKKDAIRANVAAKSARIMANQTSMIKQTSAKRAAG